MHHEERPWGSFTTLVDEPNHKVKTITVKAGQQLSLQSHKQRHEYWTIVSGMGLFITGYSVEDLEHEIVRAGDCVDIPPGEIHRIKAGGEDLTFIEVQLGTYFGEDDITRYEDDFGRA